jgi:putative phosphoesterase
MNSRARRRVRVGLVSDTHGLLRPEAMAALRGSEHVIHAGDIGDVEILRRLSAVAPVTAVRGNNDVGDWADAVPTTQRLDLLGTRIYVIHDLATLDIDPAAEGIDVVVSGHSHRPQRERRQGVLYVNPGSAGPRRFRLPIAVGILTIDSEGVEAELLTLEVDATTTARPFASRAGRRA